MPSSILERMAQIKAPLHAEICVAHRAWTACPLARSPEPPLKLYQPTQTSATPTRVSGMLCVPAREKER